jgi:Integrase core domain
MPATSRPLNPGTSTNRGRVAWDSNSTSVSVTSPCRRPGHSSRRRLVQVPVRLVEGVGCGVDLAPQFADLVGDMALRERFLGDGQADNLRVDGAEGGDDVLHLRIEARQLARELLPRSELVFERRSGLSVGIVSPPLSSAHSPTSRSSGSSQSGCSPTMRLSTDTIARYASSTSCTASSTASFVPGGRRQTGRSSANQQTLRREWGLGRVYRSSDYRADALSHWLDYYNSRIPHSLLGGRPPITRVHNLPRQDI